MNKKQAEVVAVQSLEWLAGQEDLLPVFLGASGAQINDLKTMAEDPDFLASVLDFILIGDSSVMGFCDAVGIPYDTPMRARFELEGGVQSEFN